MKPSPSGSLVRSWREAGPVGSGGDGAILPAWATLEHLNFLPQPFASDWLWKTVERAFLADGAATSRESFEQGGRGPGRNLDHWPPAAADGFAPKPAGGAGSVARWSSRLDGVHF